MGSRPPWAQLYFMSLMNLKFYLFWGGGGVPHKNTLESDF